MNPAGSPAEPLTNLPPPSRPLPGRPSGWFPLLWPLGMVLPPFYLESISWIVRFFYLVFTSSLYLIQKSEIHSKKEFSGTNFKKDWTLSKV